MSDDEKEILLDISEPDEAVIRTLWTMPGDLLMLGAGGKIGHGLALMAKRAFEAGGKKNRVLAVSRFTSPESRAALEADGITTISCDLSDVDAVQRLPDASDIVYLAGQKFGTSSAMSLTWMLNTVVPGVVARRWPQSRIAVYSSGNVYPFTAVDSGGPDESVAPEPIGEYAQSVLGRERIFEHYSRTLGTKVCTIRLNYANEPRYGVLVDLAAKIQAGQAIDLAQGYVNIVWQGDCNRITLRSFEIAESPPRVLNLAGPETLAVRDLATRLGEALGVKPIFEGRPAKTALLSNSTFCWSNFGPPRTSVDTMIERVAAHLKAGGRTMGKPTHFEARDGKF
ncbi:MAG: NAD(P)-dependent oxidoreductase [Planctomycetota bacterium]|nr:NAD(P)-dependent oxidoreductase [Planctomycetota bacterium]